MIVTIRIVEQITANSFYPQHDPFHRDRRNSFFHMFYIWIDNNNLLGLHNKHFITHMKFAVTADTEKDFHEVMGMTGTMPLLFISITGNI